MKEIVEVQIANPAHHSCNKDPHVQSQTQAWALRVCVSHLQLSILKPAPASHLSLHSCLGLNKKLGRREKPYLHQGVQVHVGVQLLQAAGFDKLAIRSPLVPGACCVQEGEMAGHAAGKGLRQV